MNQYREEIAELIPKAETGEQWAEICRLEVLAVEQERKHPDCDERCQLREHKGYISCQLTGRCEYAAVQ